MAADQALHRVTERLQALVAVDPHADCTAVASWIEGVVQVMELPVGTPLPPERAWAQTLGLSRHRLRQALQVVAATGTISSSSRHGWVVSALPRHRIEPLVLMTAHPINHPSYRLPEYYPSNLDLGIVAELQRAEIPFSCVPPQQWQRAIACARVMVLLSEIEPEAIAEATRRGISLICLYELNRLDSGDTVRLDFARSQQLLLRALAERGCRRPLNLWPMHQGTSVQPPWHLAIRDQVHPDICRQLGLEIMPTVWYPTLLSKQDFQAVDDQLAVLTGHLRLALQRGPAPDAILMAADAQCPMGRAALRAAGYDDRVVLTGHDHHPAFTATLTPEQRPAASIDRNHPHWIASAVDLITTRLRHPGPPRRILVPPILVTE